MIKINEIRSEYVYQPNLNTVLRAEELQAQWQTMPFEERIGWYEAKVIRKKLNAKEFLEHAFDDLEQSDGYEDMAETCMDSISTEEISELQALLNKICDNPSFDVYYPETKISPE